MYIKSIDEILKQKMAFIQQMNIHHKYIGQVGRMFANGPGDLGSIPGRVIPKNSKMVLDTDLLNTQHYNVRIKGKMEHSWGKE